MLRPPGNTVRAAASVQKEQISTCQHLQSSSYNKHIIHWVNNHLRKYHSYQLPVFAKRAIIASQTCFMKCIWNNMCFFIKLIWVNSMPQSILDTVYCCHPDARVQENVIKWTPGCTPCGHTTMHWKCNSGCPNGIPVSLYAPLNASVINKSLCDFIA